MRTSARVLLGNRGGGATQDQEARRRQGFDPARRRRERWRLRYGLIQSYIFLGDPARVPIPSDEPFVGNVKHEHSTSYR